MGKNCVVGFFFFKFLIIINRFHCKKQNIKFSEKFSLSVCTTLNLIKKIAIVSYDYFMKTNIVTSQWKFKVLLKWFYLNQLDLA